MKKTVWKLYSGASWTLGELWQVLKYTGLTVAVGYLLALIAHVW